jgi:hypothetical protein
MYQKVRGGSGKEDYKKKSLSGMPQIWPCRQRETSQTISACKTREIGTSDLPHPWFEHDVPHKRTTSLEEAFKVSREFRDKTRNANINIRARPGLRSSGESTLQEPSQNFHNGVSTTEVAVEIHRYENQPHRAAL